MHVRKMFPWRTGFYFCLLWVKGGRGVFLPVPSSSPRKEKKIDLPLFHSHGSYYGRLHRRDICCAINNRARLLRVPPVLPSCGGPCSCALIVLCLHHEEPPRVCPPRFPAALVPNQTAPSLHRARRERKAVGGPQPLISFCLCAPWLRGFASSDDPNKHRHD